MTTQPIFERDPSDPERQKINPALKLALEIGPLLVFFFGNSRGAWLADRFPVLADLGGPIFVATALFMAATILSLAVSWTLTRTLPIMPLVSGVVVITFGALTLWLQDELFIKLKPTIINTMFGGILLVALFGFRKSLLRYVLDSAFNIDEQGWNKLTLRWGVYFLVMAVVNEIVWRNFSTDFWVAFKVWGNAPLAVMFTLAQMPLIMRHSLDKPADGIGRFHRRASSAPRPVSATGLSLSLEDGRPEHRNVYIVIAILGTARSVVLQLRSAARNFVRENKTARAASCRPGLGVHHPSVHLCTNNRAPFPSPSAGAHPGFRERTAQL